KNFFYTGPWALSATTPMARQNKVFLLLFVHKNKPSLPLPVQPADTWRKARQPVMPLHVLKQ
ncbi:MAG TPA: hypothetical protein VNC39_17225, partial [Acidocella sp.]|uniref:hypothetical protein n=1 Tax=Acidocella sp. TaxID=50710 RepID=UPI002BFFC9DE